MEFAPEEPLGTQPLGKSGGMGRSVGHGGGTLGGTTEGTWVGGGITSDAVGRWKVMFSSALRDLQGAPPVENLLVGLASKNSPHGRTGAGQRHGQWETKELGRPW